MRNELFRDFAYFGVNPYLSNISIIGKLDLGAGMPDPIGKFSPSASSIYHLNLATQRSRVNPMQNDLSQ